MTEAEIQNQILRHFGNDPRLRIWRSNSGKMKSPEGRWVQFNFAGMADLSGFLAPSGRAIYIEVKAEKGRQSKEQIQFQNLCRKFGAIYIVARDVATVEKAICEALSHSVSSLGAISQ